MFGRVNHIDRVDIEHCFTLLLGFYWTLIHIFLLASLTHKTFTRTGENSVGLLVAPVLS